MKTKSTEFEKFDKTMRGLLAVPYSELQKKLEEEKASKGQTQKEAAYFDRFFPRFFIPKEASCLDVDNLSSSQSLCRSVLCR